MTLPVVVQYWDKSPPQEVQVLMDSWGSSGEAGFEYRLFNDETAMAFIREYYDRRTLNAYTSCAVPAMKADFFRYCVLLVHPGIYADADVRKAAPIFPLYRKLERGLLFLRGNRLANDFMIVKNGCDPLLESILRTATVNIEQRTSNNVWSVTGPGIASRLYHTLGPGHRLFAGYEIVTVLEVRKYVNFNWQLEYKRTDSHWVEHQKSHSIFAEAAYGNPTDGALNMSKKS